MNSVKTKMLLVGALLILGGVLGSGSNTRLIAQKQSAADKPWRELISSEGRFSVLLPGIPSEMFVPVPGQIVSTEMRVFAIKTSVAVYAVTYSDFPSGAEPEELKTAFDNGRDRALTEDKLQLISEKDVSAPGIIGREYVMDNGAFVIRNRVYYNQGRLYQAIFSGPVLNGMPPGLVQYYDGLAAKFFKSFKIGS